MKNSFLRITLVALAIFFTSTIIIASPDKDVNKSFDAKDKIKVKLAISDCELKASPDNKIHAHVKYSYPDDQYEVRFKEKSTSITMEEKFFGEDADGSAEWTVSIPEGVKVELNTGTGDLVISVKKVEIDGNTGTGDIEVSDSNGEFELNTGTGSLYVTGCSGEFELNSGTGKVIIKKSSGNFDGNSGTGKVVAENITIEDEAEFNCGTGDVEVIKPMGDDFDLSLNSGTNDAVLDMDGEPLEGYFEFKASARSGRIRASLDFDQEKEHGNNSNVKSVTLKKKTPRFFISTGTGTAELKK